jgi:hypothetical protein
MTPAAAVAASWYVIVAPVTLAVMPLIIVCAPVESGRSPALVPLPPDAIDMLRVTPAGIARLICAMTVYEFGFVGFVTEYVVAELVTAAGAEPAAAAETVILAGEPDTEICARASLVQTAKTSNTAVRRI